MIEDSATAFLRALRLRCGDGAPAIRIEELASRSWASAAFCGARHRVVFAIEGAGAGEAADAFLDGMEEAEFDLRGHVLADIALIAAERAEDGERIRISLEALTVADL